MDKDLDLNTSGALPKGSSGSGFGASSGDLKRGFKQVSDPEGSVYDSDNLGGTNAVGNPVTRGGFAGRPLGWAR